MQRRCGDCQFQAVTALLCPAGRADRFEFTPRVEKPTKGTDLVDYTAEARAANIAVMKLSTAVDLVRETEEAIFRKYGKPMQDTPEHVLAVNNRAVIRELVIAVGELGRILGDVLGTLDSRVTTEAAQATK